MKKNRINITKLLKECPHNMELNCVIFKKPVKYMGLTKSGTYIKIKTSCGEVFYLTKEGYLHDMADSKCIIFPKGKTTWSGFVPPCKFKDGDIVACDAEKGVQLFIFKEYIYNHDCVKCYMMLDCGGEIDFGIDDYYVERFATEEEKRKLFKAIKDNGYRWNTETNALEELVNMEDKEINNFNVLPGLYKCVHRMFDGTPDGKLLFEVGNIYRCLSKHDRAEFEVSWGHSIYLEDPVVCKHFIPFEKQGEQKSNPCEKCNHIKLNCHNFPCSKKKAFNQGKSALEAIREEKVDNANNIEPKFKVGDRIKQIGSPRSYIIQSIEFDRYILHNNQFVRFKDEHIYELAPNKFDISNLKPFDKVLVRTKGFIHVWTIAFYDGYHPNVGGSFRPFGVTCGEYFQQCIPYEGNEHLRGTTNDCDDFYKNWQ